jgi:hypothetical protein
MKRHACILAAIASITACTDAKTTSWLHPPPKSLGTRYDRMVDEAAYFEVPTSELASAEARLAEDSVVLLGDASAFLGKKNAICESPASVYLVRAQFANGAGSRFNLYLVGTALVVSHFSLGGNTRLKRTALIVCLEQKPLEVLGVVGGAI